MAIMHPTLSVSCLIPGESAAALKLTRFGLKVGGSVLKFLLVIMISVQDLYNQKQYYYMRSTNKTSGVSTGLD